MGRKTLYVAITNHGFGHATRATAVAAKLKQLQPEVDIILATTAPQWLLESYFDGCYQLRKVAVDIGVLQQDSLTMDKAATLKALQDIRTHQTELIEREATFLKAARVDLVLGDIPPLMAIAAKAAGVPCWMMSNFGWDFIYRPWGGEFIAIADWIATCFADCDRLFRLPFHEPMEAFPKITDVGLTGGSPRIEQAELRSRFALAAPIDKTVLLTFGGLGLAQIPYAELARFPDWQFITFDQMAPNLDNLCKISDRALRPVDFMPLCSRVVSKPGFSTFSEACRLNIPVVTVTRDDFAEGPVLVAGLQASYYHQILSPRQFVEGGWDFLHRDPDPPRTSNRFSTTGNTDIATAILAQLGK
ncbi:MAG: glycosyl transferase [Leptolyngbyaceae cyanobacterium]